MLQELPLGKTCLPRDFIHCRRFPSMCQTWRTHNPSLKADFSEMEGRHLIHPLKPVTVFCSPQWQKPKYNPPGGHWSSITHPDSTVSEVLQTQDFQCEKDFCSTKNKQSNPAFILICATQVFGIYKVVDNGNIWN